MLVVKKGDNSKLSKNPTNTIWKVKLIALAMKHF